MVLQRPTLRTKLMAIAVIGTVIMATLGGLLIFTARNAKQEVERSQKSYHLVAAYTRLVYQASELESESWSHLNGAEGAIGDPSRLQGGAARQRFMQLLDHTTEHAVQAGPERQAANADIRRLAQEVLRTHDRFDEIGRELQRLTQEQGIRGATAYADRMFQPFSAFNEAVKAEVDAGDAAISSATERAAKLTRMVVAVAIASFLGGLVLMHMEFKLIFGRLRRGLDRLEGGVRAFGSGDLKRRIKLGGADELARLSDAFDSMAGELADKQRALEAAKCGLETAVAERTRELETANTALAAEDERRRRFLAEVGHELRTPLTIIRGEAQVALRAADRGCVDPGPAFGRILEQTQGMGRLVEDLFLIARAEAGGLPLMRRSIDLADVAARAAADFEALAAERGSRLVVPSREPVWAEADPDRIRQAVAALVDNALRHAGAGVAVELHTWEEDGFAVIAVCDDGPGVPAETAGELFGRFRRGETRGDGSGLGLSVVRALAEAHGGSASIENREHGGARACIRLPRAVLLKEAAE